LHFFFIILFLVINSVLQPKKACGKAKTNSNKNLSKIDLMKQSLMKDVKITTSLLIDCITKELVITVLVGKPYKN